MRMIEKKPTLKMTVEEYETVRKFFSVMEDSEPLEAYDWCEIIDDFPRVRPESVIQGHLYNVEIEDC